MPLCRDGLTRTLRSALFPRVGVCVLSRKSNPLVASAKPVELYEDGGWKVDGTGSSR